MPAGKRVPVAGVRARLLYTKWQRQRCDNSAMTLHNGFATNFQVSPLFSMRTVLLASSQSGRSFDADAWCKRALMKALWWTHRKEKTLSSDPRDVRWHAAAAVNVKEKLNSLQVQATTKTIEFSRNT